MLSESNNIASPRRKIFKKRIFKLHKYDTINLNIVKHLFYPECLIYQPVKISSGFPTETFLLPAGKAVYPRFNKDSVTLDDNLYETLKSII